MSILIESEHIWAGICWVGRHQPKVNLRQIFYCIVSCIGLLEVLRFARRPAFTLLTFVQRKLPNVQFVLSFRLLWPSFAIVDASLNERNCQLCNGNLEKTCYWARVLNKFINFGFSARTRALDSNPKRIFCTGWLQHSLPRWRSYSLNSMLHYDEKYLEYALL